MLNHKLQVQRPDGTWGMRSVRDAQQPANHRKRPRAVLKAPPEARPLQPMAEAHLATLDEWAAQQPVKRPRTSRANLLGRRRRAEDEQTRRRVEELGARAVASGQRPSAQTRLEQLRQRVRARLSEAA